MSVRFNFSDLPSVMKVLNWNTQADKLSVRTPKFERSRQLVTRHNADVICLTEAFPESMPEKRNTVTSDLSEWKIHEDRGARKVVLWSRFGWTDVDRRGSESLPKGRFVRATTTFEETDLTVVGMCIPYHDYHTRERWWGTRTKRRWEGACEYLDALRDNILVEPGFCKRTILLGDFNLEIPPRGYPGKKSVVNQKREATFSGWTMPTAGVWDDPALDKTFKDHIALSPDIRAQPPQFLGRFDIDGSELSDHNGVCIDIELP